MLSTTRLKQFEEFVAASTREELIWVNGYLSGLIKEETATAPVAIKTSPAKRITITYGTETGNAQKLATAFASKAKQRGIPVKLAGLDQYRLTDLAKEEFFFTIISTQGEGEPPIAAKPFYDHIHKNGFKVPTMRYGVLALGDTAYPLFCKTGEEVDEQLEKLGGQRLLPMQKCDLDFETDANRWMDTVLEQILSSTVEAPALPVAPAAVVKTPAEKKWYTGTVLENINLTARGSVKKTYHLALDTPGVVYLPGDSIAIVPPNSAPEANRVLSLLPLAAEQTITWRDADYTVKELVTEKINIRFLSEKLVQQYATLTGQNIPAGKKDLQTLLQQWPITEAGIAQTVLQAMLPIAPRIYNIASSPSAHPDEIAILIAQDCFEDNGILSTGLCTTYIESLKPGDPVSFFIQTNKRFRLPTSDKDVIMIGPGTGVAPFRSFVAERDANGDTGRNWLFFGETDFTTDFYYQTEWQTWFNTGVLSSISLAFEKNNNGITTVEQKLESQAETLYQWLSNGASLFLCGQKEPMGKAVEKSIVQIIKTQGGLTDDGAVAYVEQLKKEGRYVKDLY
jgi:sulfite reductase (NADPH) flavoprotein alpha-component